MCRDAGLRDEAMTSGLAVNGSTSLANDRQFSGGAAAAASAG
jgi:hypothetical protein